MRSFAALRMTIRSVVFFLLLSIRGSAMAELRGYNEVAVDIPFQGGAMLTYSRMWILAKYVHGGFVAGGGQINREFDLSLGNGLEATAQTQALVLPYVGPRIGFYFPYVGLSLGYGAFWAKTDIDVEWPGVGTLTGEQKGWGSGFYTPVVVLDFFNRKSGMIFSLGIGGYLGTSYPDLEARQGGNRVVTDENPLDTITLRFGATWTGRKSVTKSDDF